MLFEQGFPNFTFGSHASSFLPLFIGNCLQDFDASSIILSDYFTTTLFFDQAGLTSEVLTALNLPIFAIDTWDSSKSPEDIDLFIDGSRRVTTWPDVVKSICPAPFLALDSTPAVYASLPEPISLSKTARAELRSAIGLSDNSRAVLFCSAGWQHAHFESEAGRRLRGALPLLVADLVSRIGKNVHLVHVGPSEYDLNGKMNGRYHFMSPCSPRAFDELLASMDLLLSANISATTIAKAMLCEVPTLVLQNSFLVRTKEEAEAAMSVPPSAWFRQWLAESVPIYPFALWPLGYHRFLEPLLRENSYVDALEVVELLDEERIHSSMSALLFDETERQERLHKQTAYMSDVRCLPTGAEIIWSGLD
jgi:hypothetical protein